MIESKKKHIVLIVPRGEAVRNFLYTETLKTLHQHLRVTILSIVDDAAFIDKFSHYTDQIIKLQEFNEAKLLDKIRQIIHDAHFKLLNSYVAVNYFDRAREKAKNEGSSFKYFISELVYKLLANNLLLRFLTRLENYLTWRLRPNDYFVELFTKLKPDLVFNTSHIHGPAGELPAKIASHLGIPVAGFVFSWDNLTSRSRITVPYDYYFVWTEQIKKDLLRIYPYVNGKNVFVTGTPQFDFHFKENFDISLEQLAENIGFDPSRPYILYTTGIDRHFPDEHFTVLKVIEYLDQLDMQIRPQLIVRTYVKGTSKEMWAIKDKNIPDVYFPKVEWDEVMFTPAYSDLTIYSGLLKYAALGINVASTVTLELYIYGKPVINLAYDPTGSNLDPLMGYYRHFLFDHFAPVKESGGSATACSDEDLKRYMKEAFTDPEKRLGKQTKFINGMFGNSLDGRSGMRVAETLIKILRKND